MKKIISGTQAKKLIYEFFQRQNFSSAELRKIKRLAMKHSIKLGEYRKNFCKKCLAQLKGDIRITKKHRTLKCACCGYKNKVNISKT